MPDLTINLSAQAIEMLNHMKRWGVYGLTAEEIAARMVDQVLIDKSERGLFKIKPKDALEPFQVKRI